MACLALLLGCSTPPPHPQGSPQHSLQNSPPAAQPGQTARPSREPVALGPSSGCDAGDPLRPGVHTLTHDGQPRRYLLALPRAAGPRPLVLDLHGLGGTPARQSAYSRLAEQGTGRGYIVATPQASPEAIGWGLPGLFGPDDAGFLGALLDELERRLCVDTRREFAAGMSMGAGMATGLICGLDGRLAGVAAVAGLNIVPPCERAGPATIVAFHGTADRIVPYDSGHPFQDQRGRLRALADLITLPPVEDTFRRWAQIFRCRRDVAAAQGQVRVREWRSCAGGAVLRLYTVRGGGHTWPGAVPIGRLGRTDPLGATALILDAFDAAARR